MSVFLFITVINEFFEIPTSLVYSDPLFIKFNKNLCPSVYFDPLFIRHLKVGNIPKDFTINTT